MHGYTDTPIEFSEQDVMDVRVYTESLSEFILMCSTPMTIAIQGDWGSGKTSMMNMIRRNIEDQIVPIWFNTWQYSQFDMASYLSISLLGNFLEKIGADKNSKDFLKGLAMGLTSFGKTAAVAVTEQLVGGTVAGNLKDKLSESGVSQDSSKILEELRSKIGKAVEAKLAASNKERVVVFVDDLDRLAPEKAVELLEVLKIFMDVPRCVFVLAVDYSVVTLGLEKKFGVTVGHAKGKSFFDKIIQLPFSIPIAQYDISGFIKSLLSNMGIACTEEEVMTYLDLVDLSIGCNPRSMKRLFNSFILLNTVAKKKGLFNDDEDDEIQVQDKQIILFATLCLQMAFSELYEHMIKKKNDLDLEFFTSIKDLDAIKTNPAFEELRSNLPIKDDLHYNKIARFMSVFFKCIKHNDDINVLSESELMNFLSTLSFSAITANTHEDVRNDKVQKYQKLDYLNWDSYQKSVLADVPDEIVKNYKITHDKLIDLLGDDLEIKYTKTFVSFRKKSARGRQKIVAMLGYFKNSVCLFDASSLGLNIEMPQVFSKIEGKNKKAGKFISLQITPDLFEDEKIIKYTKLMFSSIN